MTRVRWIEFYSEFFRELKVKLFKANIMQYKAILSRDAINREVYYMLSHLERNYLSSHLSWLHLHDFPSHPRAMSLFLTARNGIL